MSYAGFFAGALQVQLEERGEVVTGPPGHVRPRALLDTAKLTLRTDARGYVLVPDTGDAIAPTRVSVRVVVRALPGAPADVSIPFHVALEPVGALVPLPPSTTGVLVACVVFLLLAAALTPRVVAWLVRGGGGPAPIRAGSSASGVVKRA